ncbi:hypothetical protein NDU88_001835 [Pleurodeles waltl]|uniref:Uncharacterized protein n=1 Tax=Pleurodeles waltl TaxID=8319 RepID=A0AAV7PDM7_PLEWA|nr:hypothetical protein NDU88_001835 [Pleurodeles waltl]
MSTSNTAPLTPQRQLGPQQQVPRVFFHTPPSSLLTGGLSLRASQLYRPQSCTRGCVLSQAGPACRGHQILPTRQHEQPGPWVQHPWGPHTPSNSAGSTACLQACRGVSQVQGRHRPSAAVVFGPDPVPATSLPPAARACSKKRRRSRKASFLLQFP